MDFEKIKTSLFTRGKALMPYLSILFYPTKKVTDLFFMVSLAIVKSTSFEKARLGSVMFHEYFNDILTAKKQEKSLNLKPNLGEIGAVVEMAKLSYSLAILLLGVMYFFLTITIPLSLVPVFQTLSISLKLALVIAPLLMFWYIGVIFKLAIVLFRKQFPQHIMKLYLKEEFAYVYSKASEIDEESANLTIDYLKESIMIKSNYLYAAKIEELNQKIEEK